VDGTACASFGWLRPSLWLHAKAEQKIRGHLQLSSHKLLAFNRHHLIRV